MDEETKNKIADYFDPWELVSLLGSRLSTRDIVDAFEDDVEDALEGLEELMNE